MALSAIAVTQTSQAISDGLLVSQLDRNMVLPKRQESQHESVTWSLVSADNLCDLARCSAGRSPHGHASGTCEACGSEEAAAGTVPELGRTRGRPRASCCRVRPRP